MGAKAPPVVPITGKLASPIKGSATLTDAQAADLEAGMWYFNVHTAKYPDGEIRGKSSRRSSPPASGARQWGAPSSRCPLNPNGCP